MRIPSTVTSCVSMVLALAGATALAELPSYTGGIYGDALSAHDGKLRWAVGVQNVQVSRSAPDNPGATDGSATIYRHHQMLAYWGGRFWSFHSGGVQLCWSTNGLDWRPGVDSSDVIHGGASRMAFYVAPNGRFLVSQANAGRSGGPGERLVREILGPKTYGAETYNVKTNFAGPLLTGAPYYASSGDSGLRAACEALLADPLFCQQWQEEDQDPNFYTISTEILPGVREWKAFNWYRLPDNRIVGAWKRHYMALSTGTNWTRASVPPPGTVTSFGFNPSAKVWGTRTEDGLYAFVGCTPGKPKGDLHRRWPLAVTTSRDGLDFDTPYLVIAGDMPPQRYENANGDDKNSGPQYVRGICPGNGNPPGTDLWLTYSMNKEDIWVACVPTPIVGEATNDIRDDFQGVPPGHFVPGWNTYSPQWAPVTIAEEGTNRFLRLEDRDPCDYASVMRVFRQSKTARLSFLARAHQAGKAAAPLEIDVVSANGSRAVTLRFDPTARRILAWNGAHQQNLQPYSTNQWLRLEVVVDAARHLYTLTVDGVSVLKEGAFLETADSVERIVFRTGEFRLRDFTRRPHVDGTWLTDRISQADVLQATTTYDLDEFAADKLSDEPATVASATPTVRNQREPDGAKVESTSAAGYSDAPANPAMRPIQDVPGLARVLLIGDSISIGYTLPVRERLAGKANVHRIPENGGPTTNGLANLDVWLGTQRWDVIHFNWGLHDLKIMASGQQQVPLPEYERSLDQLVQRLQQSGARLIWATTTPVPEGKLGTPRRPEDVPIYNETARKVMEKHGVTVDDLYAFALPQLSKIQIPNNVHFTTDGSAALARPVAESIMTALTKR